MFIELIFGLANNVYLTTVYNYSIAFFLSYANTFTILQKYKFSLSIRYCSSITFILHILSNHLIYSIIENNKKLPKQGFISQLNSISVLSQYQLSYDRKVLKRFFKYRSISNGISSIINIPSMIPSAFCSFFPM